MTGFESAGRTGNPSRGDLSNCSFLSETYDLLEAPMQPIDKIQQTQIWQQNQYLADSGIQSAINTHTPSINSKLSIDDLEHNDRPICQSSTPFASAWPANGPMSIYPLDSCILSPETPSASSLIGIDRVSDVSTLTCSRSEANCDLRGNKLPEIDTGEAESAIPELVRLIKDEDDQVVIYQASMMVFQLSKSEAIDALIQSKEMISCILEALNRTDDPETVRFLAGTLYNMSQTQTGLKEIFLANCVPCLVILLNSPIESVLFYAITTLHNLLLHQEGAKVVVRQSGCLKKLTSLLQKNNIKFLTICTDCLQILAFGHQESKFSILSAGGPIELIRILRTYQYEKLLWTTARVLKVLSVCTSNKPVIIEAGGMEALAKHLLHPSPRLVLNCLWTLRNLSDAATKLNDLQPLLQTLVQLLGSNDINVVACSVGILSNLTCNNSNNKLLVYRRGGLHGLLHVIGHSNAKEDILETCMCALRHLTSRHEEEEKARCEFVSQLGGLVIVANILHAATSGVCPELGLTSQTTQNCLTSWTLIKAIVGLLRNLSMNINNHCLLLESGIVSGLLILLYAAQFEITKLKNSCISHPSPQNPTNAQHARLEEIVEGICVAMHMLARDPSIRLHLSHSRAPTINLAGFSPCSPGISIFAHFLFSPNECIQRAAAGILVEVTQDLDYPNLLGSVPGLSSRLEELSHSRNEVIASYISTLILLLNEDRKFNNTSESMISPHLEKLSTPPLPMDTGRFQSDYGPVSQSYSQTYPNCRYPQQYSRMQQSNYQLYAQQTPMESVTSPTSPPGSLMAMVGPPPPAYGCGIAQHPHCYQQPVNESVYPTCWSSYSAQCPDSLMHQNLNDDQLYSRFPTPPSPMAGSVGNLPPLSPRISTYRGSPNYYTPMGQNTLFDDQTAFMSPQLQSAELCSPMTSPVANSKADNRGCFHMDTSGYASPCSEKHTFAGGGICGKAGVIPARQGQRHTSFVNQQAFSDGCGMPMATPQSPHEFISLDRGSGKSLRNPNQDQWYS